MDANKRWLIAIILIPSALWLTLALLAVDQPSQAFLWLVRIVLGVVGAASLGLFFVLRRVKLPQPAWAYRLAIVGSIFFCIQTVILDALVWVHSFSCRLVFLPSSTKPVKIDPVTVAHRRRKPGASGGKDSRPSPLITDSWRAKEASRSLKLPSALPNW